MKQILLASLLLAFAGTFATGCRTETGALTPRNTARFDAENRESFVLMDRRAQRSITCSSILQRTLPDGRLEASANVRNRENRRLQVQVNCDFKDAGGFVVDSTPWQTLILTENGQETVRFTSINNEAKRFTIRIREAR